jgi:Na+-transporting methylmalonyl-CoA/oxaloacetate decarboxylase gamma subunit|tara:strand:+ start:173 stop:586 length:414 start_codon:yes stop_codon:yes gene_type:complete
MLSIITQLLPVVGEVIDRVVPDPKAREEAKLQMVKQAQEGKFKQAEQQLSVIMAEAQSKDPWTSRARPAFLYVVYLLILTSIPMAIVHAFNPELSQRLIEGFNGWLTAIPEPIITLFGVGYLGYTGARSYDKFKIKR